MEMHEIRYFLVAYDTLNFHRAAEACHVTQPALTRAVQKLEGEAGARLVAAVRDYDWANKAQVPSAQSLAAAAPASPGGRHMVARTRLRTIDPTMAAAADLMAGALLGCRSRAAGGRKP